MILGFVFHVRSSLNLCSCLLPPWFCITSCASWSLQFENNSDSHVIGAPTDAYWKSGAGGFCLYIIPSLDMVIYKLGGATVQVLAAKY